MKKKSTMFRMTSCALMAAVMCALCPLSIPIGPVPISLAIFVILLTVSILGPWDAAISCGVYLLLGAVGMPVFTGFQGGLAKLAGPTGGYLAGYLPMILVCGLFMRRTKENLWLTMLGMALGVAVDYALGTAWFVFQARSTWAHALAVCVYPFIPFDLGKIVLAALLGKVIRTALRKAKLLTQEKASE